MKRHHNQGTIEIGVAAATASLMACATSSLILRLFARSRTILPTKTNAIFMLYSNVYVQSRNAWFFIHSFTSVCVRVFIRKVIHRTIYPYSFGYAVLWLRICSTIATHPHFHAPLYIHSLIVLLFARSHRECAREWRYLALLTVKAHTPHPSNCCWIIVSCVCKLSVCRFSAIFKSNKNSNSFTKRP